MKEKELQVLRMQYYNFEVMRSEKKLLSCSSTVQKDDEDFFSLHTYVISYTAKTLWLTVISPFGHWAGGVAGGGDKGIWRIVRSSEKILATPLLVRIVPYSTLALFKSGAREC